MIWQEIHLNGSAALILYGGQVGTLECIGGGSDGTLRISIGDVIHELPNSIDIGEQSPQPRVFLIESGVGNEFLIFGGANAYRMAVDGTRLGTIKLFRKNSDQEYWQTEIVERHTDLIVIYEAGVLVIDENLKALSHQPKLYNDVFTKMEGNGIGFLRDHEKEWVMVLCESSVEPVDSEK